MNVKRASTARGKWGNLVGQVERVRFERGNQDGAICRLQDMTGLPDSSWPDPTPRIGESLDVRIVSVHGNGTRHYCFVLPASFEEPSAKDSATANLQKHTEGKKPSPVEDDFFFSAPEIPPDAVKVRFKYRGKRLLGNYEGRPLDSDWRGWGCERQPKVGETWLVRMQIRPGYEVAFAIAVQGPIKKKK